MRIANNDAYAIAKEARTGADVMFALEDVLLARSQGEDKTQITLRNNIVVVIEAPISTVTVAIASDTANRSELLEDEPEDASTPE